MWDPEKGMESILGRGVSSFGLENVTVTNQTAQLGTNAFLHCHVRNMADKQSIEVLTKPLVVGTRSHSDWEVLADWREVNVNKQLPTRCLPPVTMMIVIKLYHRMYSILTSNNTLQRGKQFLESGSNLIERRFA
ncbi:hypothetical protein E2C01_093669 [Portunus trituberculatus]|uniref:Uncharacterized protein n=1 Tax=Portunus trituberculatus TaxID=210409 RepID=A0A5B7JUT1_PORTR|nr:hypothetical protein [Portunus trituberculatus]